MIREYNDYWLLEHNTFGIRVKARHFLEYSSAEELIEIIRNNRIATPYLHIGGGSNLLFVKDFEGTVLHSSITGVEVVSETEEEVLLRVGAGMVWDDFVAYCVEHQWYGIENLSIIPGEVGAAAVQNIGAYGVEAKDVITSVEVVTVGGCKHKYDVRDCDYSYRHSVFKTPAMKGSFVTFVSFRLSKLPVYRLEYGSIKEELKKYPEVTLANVRRAIISIREDKLPNPKEIGNAGSFFMNPVVAETVFENIYNRYPSMPFYKVDEGKVKIPAGWLIEQSGWKGKALGKARVYEKQALVLVNNGGATGADVLALSDAVRASVKEKFGIDIIPEVRIIN